MQRNKMEILGNNVIIRILKCYESIAANISTTGHTIPEAHFVTA
jgi:hypothetical protein